MNSYSSPRSAPNGSAAYPAPLSSLAYASQADNQHLSPAPSYHQHQQPSYRPQLSPLETHERVDGYADLSPHSQPSCGQHQHQHQHQQGPYGSYQAAAGPGPTQHQPGAHAGMSIGTQVPYSTREEGKWSTGLFKCTSFGSYCFTCWCPCIRYGYNEQRLEHLLEHRHPATKEDLSCCSGDCVFWVLAEHVGLGCVLDLLSRGKMRKHFGIQGNGCNDCLAATFCTNCAAEQEGRELTREENHLWAHLGRGPGGKGPVVEGQFASLPVPREAQNGGSYVSTHGGKK